MLAEAYSSARACLVSEQEKSEHRSQAEFAWRLKLSPAIRTSMSGCSSRKTLAAWAR